MNTTAIITFGVFATTVTSIGVGVTALALDRPPPPKPTAHMIGLEVTDDAERTRFYFRAVRDAEAVRAAVKIEEDGQQ
jgi:hypothetical protein